MNRRGSFIALDFEFMFEFWVWVRVRVRAWVRAAVTRSGCAGKMFNLKIYAIMSRKYYYINTSANTYTHNK